MDRLARGFSLFMNWFDGVCALVCGTWMAVSALCVLPLSWNDFMPVSLLDPLPIPACMKADLLWPGIALVVVNGVPNLIALGCRFAGSLRASYTWGVVAGVLLICWTAFELVYIPNALSVFYCALGVLQLVASWRARKSVG